MRVRPKQVLKPIAAPAEVPTVRIERLVTESESHTVALDFHPRLTVIGGLDAHDRSRFAEEIVGALEGYRSGVHLELLSDRGVRSAVFRPARGRHRVVEIDSRSDVTEAFADEAERIDLLARCGLNRTDAAAAMCRSSADLLAVTDHDRLVQGLANVNQSELWVAGEALSASQRRLEAIANASAEGSSDNEAAEVIEDQHEELEALRSKATGFFKGTAAVTGVALIGSLVALFIDQLIVIPPLFVMAVAMFARSALLRRAVQSRAREESDALAEFGAQSYLGFHIQRVNGLFDSEQTRRSLMSAAEAHRDAFARWTAIAGDTELAWALRHRSEIDAAARVRRDVFGPDVPTDSPDSMKVIRLAHSTVRHLSELRRVGASGESLPTLFDEVFDGIEADVLAPLLELLVRSSEQQQIILLTNSAAVMDWARVEALTGALSVLEPNGAAPGTVDPSGGTSAGTTSGATSGATNEPGANPGVLS